MKKITFIIMLFTFSLTSCKKKDCYKCHRAVEKYNMPTNKTATDRDTIIFCDKTQSQMDTIIDISNSYTTFSDGSFINSVMDCQKK